MTALQLGLDATAAGIADNERSGVYQYISHLVRGLCRADGIALTLYFALPHPRHRGSIDSFVAQASAGGRVPRVVRSALPLRLLRRLPLAVERCTGALGTFHSPAHLLLPSRAPGIVTLHDLAYLHAEGDALAVDTLDAAQRDALRQRQRFFAELAEQTARTVQRAAHIITVTETTRAQVMRHFGLAADRVSAVPLGLRPEAVAEPTPEAAAQWRSRLALPARYVLYLGNIDPNKNLFTLLDGFAAYRRRGGAADLVLAGRSVFFQPLLAQHAQRLGIAERVRFTGRVDDAALPVLYRGAQTVVMPSRLEGFGLPAIEAMACAVPVVVADAGALPEVVGDAALRVPADDAAAFGEALLKIEQDPRLAAELKRAGPPRAARFDWARAVADTLALYRRVAAGERG